MRPLAALHAVVTTVLLAGLVVQVFLAGLGVFDDPARFELHRTNGYTLWFVAIIAVVTAALARSGRGAIGMAALTVGLITLQSVLVGMRVDAPMIAALHPLNGFATLLVTIVATRLAWRGARRVAPA